MGAVVDYTHAEAGMRRLILIRDHMDVLCRLFEGKAAPLLAFHYGVLRLAQFLDAYEGFMGSLDPRQRKLVVCATGLIADVHKRRDALKNMRNGWIAHPPDDGLLAEDGSDYVRRIGLPRDPAAYYEMLLSTVVLIDTVRALLPGIAKPAVEKFNRSGATKHELRCVYPDLIAQNIRSKLDSVREEAERKFPNVQWGSLLGAAGARLDQVGPGSPGACTARRDGSREGGAERQ